MKTWKNCECATWAQALEILEARSKDYKKNGSGLTYKEYSIKQLAKYNQ